MIITGKHSQSQFNVQESKQTTKGNMIEFKKAYVVGTTVYATLEEAQEAELVTFIGVESAKRVMDNKVNVLDVLTTKPTSKPKARAINGGKKPRRVSPAALNAALQDAKQ